MKVFVIGASGYVGSHIARRFLADGHTVVGLSRTADSDGRLSAWGITPVRGDAERAETVLGACRDADVTIFAPQLLLAPEYKAVSEIVDALSGTDKTFIFTSGTGVLAQSTEGAWSPDCFAEDDLFTPCKPLALRVDTENMVREAGRRGLRTMVIRPPMIWGNDGCVIVAQILESVGKTGSACYIGAGLNLYSNVHVLDLVEVYARAVEKGISGALYHAVSGEVNYRMMAESIARAQGVAARSVTMDEAIAIWGKFFAKLVLGVCSRSRCPRTRVELGWVPQHLDVSEMFRQPLR